MATTHDLLYAETEGSCAYCGLKDFRVLTVHHIHQQEPKDESYDNKIVLCHNCHQLYHESKGPSCKDLRDIKKRLICKTLTQQGVNALKEAARKGIVVGVPYLLNHLVEMQLLELITVSTRYILEKSETIASAAYKLTDDGTNFIEKWDLK